MSLTVSKMIKGVAFAAIAITSLSTFSAEAAQTRSYLLATASTGGTFYPVGVAISTLTKVKLQPEHKISMSAINSAGAAENVKLLRENESQFAILQGLFGYYAWNGKGAIAKDGPQKDLRAVTMLWRNVEHFAIASENVKTGTISDMLALKGERMAFGKRNSGTIWSNRALLSNLGINIDKDYNLVHVGYGPSADALQNGRVSGFGIPAGVPAGAVTKVMAALGSEMTILDFNSEQAKKADGGMGLWSRYVIPAGSYPNQTKDIRTVSQPNFLAVRSDIDEEAVYLITKTIYENLPFLNSIHKATKAMSLEKAVTGLPIPLHPGALRYYKEAGIAVPENLIAK